MSEDRGIARAAGWHEPHTGESWLSRHAPYLLLLAYLYYLTQIAIELLGGPFGSYALYEMVPITARAILFLAAAALLGFVVRVVILLLRRVSGKGILRAMLGEPTWWRTWYPPGLRDPASVWGRMPAALKVVRTALWLELLLLPAGAVLVVFVLPTFEAVYASLAVPLPRMMRLCILAVQIGGYALPLILLGAALLVRRWRAGHGLPWGVALHALFSSMPDFWREGDARRLLLP